MYIQNKIPDRDVLKHAWEKFISKGKIEEGIIREEIVESWARSRSYGVDPSMEYISVDISDEERNRRFSENSTLLEIAHPFLSGLYNIVKGLEMVVFLTDSDGFILESIGEGTIWEYCVSRNAVVGSSFNEQYVGTTAVCMALDLDKPYQMMAEEHYCKIIHVATCAAAPIHDGTGKIIGCLDLTARYEIALKHPHTLGMIVAAAQFIESQLKLKIESEKSFLFSEYLKATLETMSSGLVIMNSNNVITHMNPSAERILGISFSTVSEREIGNLVKNEIILRSIMEKWEMKDHELIIEELQKKSRFLVSLKPILDLDGRQMGSVLTLKEMKGVQKLVHKVVGHEAQYTFEDIKGISAEIKQTIKQGKIIADSPSSVLIIGQSGTGKEMIAQSIHNESSRSEGPFLAINCAAIPYDLIESELFGYEPGTFTGGTRGGKSGKLELADGGTLFLDEINGMSLDMQTKLLRVLEEKKFFRLGGTRYFHLDTRIIAATNKELIEEIENGNFRSDLYYRLNVLTIHVPPLRKRKGDIDYLIRLFIQEISERLNKAVHDITPEALKYLNGMSWPGNVRELKNWIERAINFAEGNVLTIEDFTRKGYLSNEVSYPNDRALKDFESSNLFEIESDMIIKVISDCHGNLSEASRRLGIGRSTLYRKLKKYNISLSKTVSS